MRLNMPEEERSLIATFGQDDLVSKGDARITRFVLHTSPERNKEKNWKNKLERRRSRGS